MEIDLRNCKEGDVLISRLGAILKYVRPLPVDEYFQHEVEYLFANGELNTKGKLGKGTRTDDGFVFKKKRDMRFDHDIYNSVESLFLKDPNYDSCYYGFAPEVKEIIRPIKFKTSFILDHMEKMKHLIIEENEK